MARRIWLGTVILGLASSLPATALETLFSGTLSSSNNWAGVRFKVDGPAYFDLKTTISAGGSLSQTEKVCASIYKEDGTPVDYREVAADGSVQFRVRVTSGVYYAFFDLGVADPDASITDLTLCAEGSIINPFTGETIHSVPPTPSGDLPPDSTEPPPRWIFTPGPFPQRIQFYLPTHDWMFPSSAAMVYLVDWS